MHGISTRSLRPLERADRLCSDTPSRWNAQNCAATARGIMPKGLGRLQRQLLEELEIANFPLRTAALMQGRSGFEKRRALRRLVVEGFVSEVRPDTWRLSDQAQVRKRAQHPAASVLQLRSAQNAARGY